MVEPLNALIAQTQRVHLIALGNPGAGKSTWLNALIGKVVFRSGVSNSIGLSPIYATFEQDEIMYTDTPGLNDCLNRENSAEQIRMGLQQDGYYRIFFLVTLESGRIRSEDVSTMKLVLEAAPQITTSSFSIIVNKVSKSVANMYKNDPNQFIKLKTHLLQGLPAVTDRVFLNLKEDRIDDMDNELATVSDDLRNFVKESPLIRVSKGQVSYIQWDQFEKTKKALANSLKELQDSKDKYDQAQRRHLEQIRQQREAHIAALKTAETRRRAEEEAHNAAIKAAETRRRAEEEAHKAALKEAERRRAEQEALRRAEEEAHNAAIKAAETRRRAEEEAHKAALREAESRLRAAEDENNRRLNEERERQQKERAEALAGLDRLDPIYDAIAKHEESSDFHGSKPKGKKWRNEKGQIVKHGDCYKQHEKKIADYEAEADKILSRFMNS